MLLSQTSQRSDSGGRRVLRSEAYIVFALRTQRRHSTRYSLLYSPRQCVTTARDLWIDLIQRCDRSLRGHVTSDHRRAVVETRDSSSFLHQHSLCGERALKGQAALNGRVSLSAAKNEGGKRLRRPTSRQKVVQLKLSAKRGNAGLKAA